MKREYDNIAVESLDILLNERTTPQKFYDLIPMKAVIMASLLTAGVHDKYEFDQAYTHREKMSEATGLDIWIIHKVHHVFRTYDFKDRRLLDLSHIDEAFVQRLKNDAIRLSGDYLRIIKESGIANVRERYGVSYELAEKFWCLCDLMRLPGVKIIRAGLYFDSGYRSVSSFAVETTESMLRGIKNYLIRSGDKKSLPLPKEISTQIAVAKSIPGLTL